MYERLPALLRSTLYALRGGFLIRPLAIALVLGTAGAVLSSLEESFSEVGNWIPQVLFPSQQDPGVAQIILSSIATSIMTVVSIVFAILLMTLTLASTQFSPRILVSFVRDRTTQWTLGFFSEPSLTAWRRCLPQELCRIRLFRPQRYQGQCCSRLAAWRGSSTSSTTYRSPLA